MTAQTNINPFAILEQKLHNIEVMLMDIKFGNVDNETTYQLIQPTADFLGTTPNAIRVMVHKNQIPYIKKQGKLFFKKSDLIGWLESGRNTPQPIDAESILLSNKKRS